MSLSKTLNPLFGTGPRKTRPHITEKLLTVTQGTKSNKANKQTNKGADHNFSQKTLFKCFHCFINVKTGKVNHFSKF